MKRRYNLLPMNGSGNLPGILLTPLLLSFIIFFSGCTHYQYMSVDSRLYQNDSKEYILENDTVMIKYSFTGEDFRIKITLSNRLMMPLYIDLERSTIVINDQQTDNSFYLDGQRSFIAPASYVTIYTDPIRNSFIKLKSIDSLKSEIINTNIGKAYTFTEEKSPVKMRIILALTQNDDYSYPTFYDYSFWISDILQTSTSPRSFEQLPQNQFYIRQTTGFGRFLSWIGVAILIVIGAIFGSGE